MNQKVNIDAPDTKGKKVQKKAFTMGEIDDKEKGLLDDSNQELSKDISDNNLLAIP